MAASTITAEEFDLTDEDAQLPYIAAISVAVKIQKIIDPM